MRHAIGILDELFSLAHKYVIELIILMFVSLFAFWSIGYFANPLYGYKFDLNSCWAGFTAIGGAGVIAIIKYCTDSWKNSPEGIMPGKIIDRITETITKDPKGNVITETTMEERQRSERE